MLLRNSQEAGFSGEVSISKAFHIYLSAFGNTLCLNADPASKRPLNLSTFPQSDLNPARQVQGTCTKPGGDQVAAREEQLFFIGDRAVAPFPDGFGAVSV